jgi:hypothetical protein
MVGVTPGWKFVSIGFERTPVAIHGHPSYPSERHTMFVYKLEIDGRTIEFAAGEYSNGVWGFYEPA